MEPVTPDHIRYIKLGRGGRWAQRGLAHGEVHFGYRMVPHEVCLDEDWEAIAGLLMERGRSPAKAKDGVREIRDFYTLGADCLWITFADGHLWWTFAEPEVIWLGTDDDARGARMRKAIDGWRKTDIRGKPLGIDGLSTILTQVAAYRQTICRVRASDYLLRRINALEEPVVRRAQAAKAEMVEVAGGVHPAPAPRFSVTELDVPAPPRPPGADTDRVLIDLGYSGERIAELRRRGVIA